MRSAKREREFEAGGGRKNAKESREKVQAKVEVKVKIEAK